ncbi:MAG: sulfatase-like hydrolase/transferase [Oscillospiraceae bacterium]
MPYFIPLFLIALLFVTLAASLCKGKIFSFVVNCIFGVGLASYIQGNFLNLNLGLLDGSSIPWNEYSAHALINIAIWFIILLIPVGINYFSEKHWAKALAIVSLVLVGMQLTSMVTAVVKTSKTDRLAEPESYYLSNQRQFELSDSENIIIFCLDAYSNNILDEVVVKYPDAIDFLNDFTYFRNSGSVYRGTFPSAITLLTSYQLDPAVPYSNYMNHAWSSDSAAAFYGGLKNKGYDCQAFLKQEYLSDYASNIKDVFSNVTLINNGAKTINAKLMFTLLENLTIYRYAPHALKPSFWSGGDDFADIVSFKEDKNARILNWREDGTDFYNLLLNEQISVQNDRNSFIYYHLAGAHGPYTINANCERVQDGLAADQACGYLNIVKEFISQMKEAGIYDRATLVVTSDHGEYVDGIGKSSSIMFVKKPNESHESMLVSSAPVSHLDLLPTLESVIDIPVFNNAETFYTIPENSDRERQIFYYVKAKKANKNDFYGSVDEYKYTGDINTIDFSTMPSVEHPLANSFY